MKYLSLILLIVFVGCNLMNPKCSIKEHISKTKQVYSKYNYTIFYGFDPKKGGDTSYTIENINISTYCIDVVDNSDNAVLKHFEISLEKANKKNVDSIRVIAKKYLNNLNNLSQ